MTPCSRRSALRFGGLSALVATTATTGLVMPSTAAAIPALAAAPDTAPRTPTRYGVNAPGLADVRRRLRTYGSVGIARTFYGGMLPSTWNKNMEGASPDRQTQVSFKTSPAALAAGHHDRALRSWMESIPSGWRVYLTFWHEPNDELRNGAFSGREYRRAWARLSKIRRSQVNLRRGVRLSLVPVFMSYLVGKKTGWSDGWVPEPNEVSFVSWDIYGNPSGGDGLRGRYPSPAAGINPCMRASKRIGHRQWGVTEFNTPRRHWDADEHSRKIWLDRFRQHCLNTRRAAVPELGAPKILLLWEGMGTNWDQRFKTRATERWWSGVVS